MEQIKQVLITGGTRGIGAELVKQYQAQGYLVVATGRRIIPIYLESGWVYIDETINF